MKTPYDYADKVLANLKQYISAEFHNTANLMGFDEINVAGAKELTKTLYDRLKVRSEQVFRQVAKQAYRVAFQEANGVDMPDGAEIAIVLALLNRYHPVTEYAYRNEVRRKQERLMEAILAAPDRETAVAALNKAAKLWFNQSRQYADFSVDDARAQAFRDAGIEDVEYHAEKDEKTCHECMTLDGRVFSLSEAPELPRHRHCRCWLVPVRR